MSLSKFWFGKYFDKIHVYRRVEIVVEKLKKIILCVKFSNKFGFDNQAN